MPEGFEGLGSWLLAMAHGPYGMLILSVTAFSEAFILPVLPDIVLVALCLLDPSLAFLYAAICAVSSALGSLLGYGIGRFGGRPLLDRLISPLKIRAVESYYLRYGVWPVAVAGFLPLPYKIFTVTAGVFALDLKRFALASALARTSRFLLVGWLLYHYGEPVGYFIHNYFGVVALVLTAFLIVLLVCAHFCLMRSVKALGDSPTAAGRK